MTLFQIEAPRRPALAALGTALAVALFCMAPAHASSWPREPSPACVAPMPQPSPSAPHPNGRQPGCAAETGTASWYGRQHNGRPTASGEVFDMAAMTAAHRTLPMNARVLVTRLGSGRSVVVRINDRGPFVAGRIIDLSARAAELLGFKKHGLASVRLELLSDDD
ncbi:MAG: septal ring lytic transglycosylase RlpA family protein [Alphaproteobacteria bacterium]